MKGSKKESISDLLIRNITRDLVMGAEDALLAGARRAYVASRGMATGHLPSVVGQMRHFHMNESFHSALEMGAASPSPLRGNRIITGRAGVFTLARFNIKEGLWNNGRRSQTRRQMSMANAAIEKLVQPELFSDYRPPAEAVAFFVASFANSLDVQPESPVLIEIAVPDRYMKGWLFREPLDAFVKRYDQEPISVQEDLVMPKLKKNIGQQSKDGTTQ